MPEPQRYVEEAFGILTDDDLYLDCILVKPLEVQDADLNALRVWVPRYPLTKSSVITCARQEVQAFGSSANVGHLVFDLRGTGQSEGAPRDLNFDRDLQAVRLWARERFGKINLGFLGQPHGSERVEVLPIRPGVVMETYHYTPSSSKRRTPILYLATYGHFNQNDEQTCMALAQAGFDVYGMDPLRYLLHASMQGRLEARNLWQDLEALCARLPQAPYLVGRPVAAGLALIWLSGVDAAPGAIAIGRAQLAFKPQHIFASSNPHTFFLGRYVHRIQSRPVVFVREEKHPLGGEHDELASLYETTLGPRRLESTPHVTPQFLLELLHWIEEAQEA